MRTRHPFDWDKTRASQVASHALRAFAWPIQGLSSFLPPPIPYLKWPSMVALGETTFSKDARKSGRDAVASPYPSRRSRLGVTANGGSRRQKEKSPWSLSGLWKWISTYPDNDEDGNTGEGTSNQNGTVDEEAVEERSYVASPAALRLRQRGDEVWSHVKGDKALIYSRFLKHNHFRVDYHFLQWRRPPI
jgi:hypothetical protein